MPTPTKLPAVAPAPESLAILSNMGSKVLSPDFIIPDILFPAPNDPPNISMPMSFIESLGWNVAVRLPESVPTVSNLALDMSATPEQPPAKSPDLIIPSINLPGDAVLPMPKPDAPENPAPALPKVSLQEALAGLDFSTLKAMSPALGFIFIMSLLRGNR